MYLICSVIQCYYCAEHMFSITPFVRKEGLQNYKQTSRMFIQTNNGRDAESWLLQVAGRNKKFCYLICCLNIYIQINTFVDREWVRTVFSLRLKRFVYLDQLVDIVLNDRSQILFFNFLFVFTFHIFILKRSECIPTSRVLSTGWFYNCNS